MIAGVDFVATATVNFSDSAIRGGIGATPDDFLWVLSAYAAAGAAGILLLERLSRRLRYRTLLLLGLGLFAAGSLVACLSQSLPQLVLARGLQGLGGGPLMTCARVLLQLAVPAEQRRVQLRGFIVGLFGSSAGGPWLAAWLIQRGDWHALFQLHLVWALLVMLLCWAMVPKGAHSTRRIGHVDGLAVLVFSLAVLLLLHTCDDVRYQWPDGATALSLVCAGALVLGFAWHLLLHPDPWFRLGSLVSRRYLTGLLLYTLYYLLNGAMAWALPKYLASGEGFDLQSVGLLSSLAGVSTLLLLPGYFQLAPRLPDRRYVIAAGFVLAALLLWRFAGSATGGTDAGSLTPLLLIKGLFPIMVVFQVAGLTFREFRNQDYVHAYALKNVLRLIANALGAGLASLYWQQMAARGRAVLIGRFDPLQGSAPFDGPDAWQRLDAVIEQQCALISASQLFCVLALCCTLGAVAVCCQRTLR